MGDPSSKESASPKPRCPRIQHDANGLLWKAYHTHPPLRDHSRDASGSELAEIPEGTRGGLSLCSPVNPQACSPGKCG
ncbi:hypothetical protein QQF64_009225 [Cirrhinus molitorella]|uniref:Uncharacterized protein n=1 Tax=Cirrhinus molitorella TaxID=172907 RepID=A0ABR3M4Q6_9TELE